MKKNRLEAFSDGVLAIVLTIMVFEIKPPKDQSLLAFKQLMPTFSSYALSFIFIIIYWNNHHHLLHTVKRVTGKIMWANANLLFWLSLFPFTTNYMGLNNFAPLPVLVYGIVSFMAGTSYYILTLAIKKVHGKDSILEQAIGLNKKGIISPILYALAIAFAWYYPLISCTLFVCVAILWCVPDKTIEENI